MDAQQATITAPGAESQASHGKVARLKRRRCWDKVYLASVVGVPAILLPEATLLLLQADFIGCCDLT